MDVTVVSGFLVITCNKLSLADKDAPLSVSGSLLMLASSDQEHAFGQGAGIAQSRVPCVDGARKCVTGHGNVSSKSRSASCRRPGPDPSTRVALVPAFWPAFEWCLRAAPFHRARCGRRTGHSGQQAQQVRPGSELPPCGIGGADGDEPRTCFPMVLGYRTGQSRALT